ncbi:MAG: hypothetical protein A4E35_01867 [Methanoregula sp. PtaU1.Bin051]|nr:MAG: hypothetical protein A4E35_01867 [Methanoregula sp. PtaU1.Bin051]
MVPVGSCRVLAISGKLFLPVIMEGFTNFHKNPTEPFISPTVTTLQAYPSPTSLSHSPPRSQWDSAGQIIAVYQHAYTGLHSREVGS